MPAALSGVAKQVALFDFVAYVEKALLLLVLRPRATAAAAAAAAITTTTTTTN